MSVRVWCHTHLPRLRSGETPDVISVKAPGQKIDYASWVFLDHAEFRVHEHGRQRCIREGVRNVHAWVIGSERSRQRGVAPEPCPDRWRQALYDPFKGGTFVDSETLAPVLSAPYVILSGKSVYYVPGGPRDWE